MGFNLRGRSFVKLLDFNPRELTYLLDLARDLKRAKYACSEQPRLRGKNICLVFEKTSTRTRCALEVAAHDQGAGTTHLEPSSSQMGHKESLKDTARVLGRMYDAIAYRGYSQETVETLAEHADVPVYNALTDQYHPTQALCDLMTMREYSDKPLQDVAFCYAGDARNNMGNSLMIGGCLMGMDVRLAAPRSNWPGEDVVVTARAIADRNGAQLTITEDAAAGVVGCDFVHTDVWVSMGESEEVWAERIRLMRPYQVNAALMRATGNPRARFMHCLPAYHNRETRIGEQIHARFGITEMEVTEEVFESPAAIQFEQAENRMHSIKAVLVATIGT